MTTNRRAALLAGLAMLPLPALAQPEGRGGGQGRGGGPPDRGPGGQRGGPPDRGPGVQRGGPPGQPGGAQGRGGHGGRAPALGTMELNIIQGWLLANPGFATQPLPPGMRNRLAQGKPLPPGIARRTLPPDLLGRLPAYPGYDYVMVGATLVLVSIATGAVAALLTDALLRR